MLSIVIFTSVEVAYSESNLALRMILKHLRLFQDQQVDLIKDENLLICTLMKGYLHIKKMELLSDQIERLNSKDQIISL